MRHGRAVIDHASGHKEAVAAVALGSSKRWWVEDNMVSGEQDD